VLPQGLIWGIDRPSFRTAVSRRRSPSALYIYVWMERLHGLAWPFVHTGGPTIGLGAPVIPLASKERTDLHLGL
jgi:hypothetical protein